MGEDWNQEMYKWVRVAEREGQIEKGIATTYFVLLIYIGNFVMMTIFTGLLLQNFEDEIEQKVEQRKPPDMMQKSCK